MIGRNAVFHPLSFCISSLLVFSSLPQWGVGFEQSIPGSSHQWTLREMPVGVTEESE